MQGRGCQRNRFLSGKSTGIHGAVVANRFRSPSRCGESNGANAIQQLQAKFAAFCLKSLKSLNAGPIAELKLAVDAGLSSSGDTPPAPPRSIASGSSGLLSGCVLLAAPTLPTVAASSGVSILRASSSWRPESGRGELTPSLWKVVHGHLRHQILTLF